MTNKMKRLFFQCFVKQITFEMIKFSFAYAKAQKLCFNLLLIFINYTQFSSRVYKVAIFITNKQTQIHNHTKQRHTTFSRVT